MSWTPYFWIKEVSNMSFKDIIKELKDYDYDPDFKLVVDAIEERVFDVPNLPGECINLSDPIQLNFYKNLPILDIAQGYIKTRRLDTAINRPNNYYLCINDKFHRNRLIIPYIRDKKVVYYTSRKLLKDDPKAKYLMKFGSDKPIFNIEKVDPNYPYIFVCEGQIDAMFLKNAVAISGTFLTNNQEQLILQDFPFHQLVWVLDNHRFEQEEVREIIVNKLKSGENVFIFENEFEKYKDLNDFCTEKNLDHIDPDLILKSVYKGSKGLLKL